MFKSIGKAISNAYSSVKSGISNLVGSISGKSNLASVSSAPIFGSAEYMRQTASQGSTYGPNRSKVPMGATGSWTPTLSSSQLSPGLNSGLASSTGFNLSGGVGNNYYGPQLPVNISAGQQRVSSSTPSNSFVSDYGTSVPTTLSTRSMGAQTSGTGSLMSTGGTGITQPVIVNNTPTSTAVNRVDNTKLAGRMSGYRYDQTTGQYKEVQEQPEQTIDTKIQKELDLYKKYLGEKPNVYDDPDIIRATQQRRALQESLRGPTNELNAIIAKQNQDLLQLRQTGSQEGVTEAVYGGQQNAINYNAAIRAIPLQAQIAAIQGDLKLSQDYLNELTQIKQDQINKQYEANKNQFDMIKGILTKEDQRAYDELTKTNDRVYKEQQDLINYQAETISNIYENYGAKVPQSVINRINNATNKQKVVEAAGQYLSKSVANAGISQTRTSDDPFVQKLLNSAGGKPLTDTFAQKLDKGLTVLGQIGILQNNIKDVKTGPILGTFRGANPWDTNAQTIKAQLNAIVPNLARGVYGEVGVLTDNDIATYSKTLPTLKSTEDIRNAILGITVDLISKSIKRTLEVNAANGKDVSGFVDLYTEMQSTRDGIFSQIPGAKVSTQSTSQVSEGSTKVWNGVTYKVVNGVWTPQ